MNGVIGDLRFAIRSLRRTPAFTLVAIITLSLGLGMAAGAFSVVDTVLIRPLPFAASDRLVLVHATRPAGRQRHGRDHVSRRRRSRQRDRGRSRRWRS